MSLPRSNDITEVIHDVSMYDPVGVGLRKCIRNLHSYG